MKLVLFILLPVALLASQSTIKLAINETTVQEILQIAESLGGKSLSVLILGNFTYALSSKVSVQLTNVTADNSISFKYPNIFFLEPNLVSINLTNFSSFVSFNYTEIIDGLKHKAYGNLTAPSVNISIVAAFVRNVDYLQLEFQSVEVAIANLTLKTQLVSGLDLELQAAINGDLKNIESAVVAVIEAKGQSIDMVLAGLPRYLPIPPLQMMLDMSLADDTIVESTYASLSFRGEFLSYPYRQSILPFNPRPMPPLQAGGDPLMAQISEYGVQILVNALWSEINFNLTQLPAGLPIKLTTDGLGFLVPNLKKTYGPGKNVTIQISKNPLLPYVALELNNGLMELALGMALSFFVVVNPNNISHAVDLQLNFTATIGMNIDDFVLDLNIQAMSLLDVGYTNSDVGNINIVLLQKLLVALFRTILPIVNLLTTNITLPEPNLGPIIFYDSSVTILDGCLLLQAGLI